MDLNSFLRSREVSENVINCLKCEKVDENVIAPMNDEELTVYFPKQGDRIAIKNFCKRHSFPNTKRKNNLLDKLKKSLNKSFDLEERDSPFEPKQKKHNAEKEKRQIYLGWLCNENNQHDLKQVRGKKGGGTRKVSVPKYYTKKEILPIAIELFFPENFSKKGHINEFSTDILDFSGDIVPDNISINTILEKTKVKDLRFYLETTRKVSIDKENNISENKILEKNPVEKIISVTEETETGDKIEKDVTEESVIEYFNSTYIPSEESEFEELNGNNELQLVNPAEVIPEELGASQLLTLDNVITEVTLHRGNIFQELLDLYVNFKPTVNTKFEIKMISTNGEIEKGVDIGGIFRDALTEFWTNFYDYATVGACFKVPAIRHDFGENKWSAIALILAHGWKAERYFPIKIAPAFFEYCLGYDSKNMIENFLKYVSQCDAEILQASLNNFGDVNMDELLEVMENYESKWQPTEQNIERLVNDLAHKELIQKPMFVIKCWSEQLKQMITLDELHNIYSKGNPTTKNILNNLCHDGFNSGGQEKIFNFLKRFLKETSQEIRECFLRFCTGSDIVLNEIKLEFNDRKGWERRPIAHTCTSMLELSTQYENFMEFRIEFTTVLSTNNWTIDII